MKVLITGINGFVGTNLVQSWNGKHILYGLDIMQPEKDGVEKTYSWNDLENLPSVDAIIHLAGKAHDTKNQSLAEEYFQINTELTKKIFDYFINCTAEKFIFFSSVKAVADKVLSDTLTEDVIPAPVGPYGESKVKAEAYIIGKSQESEAKNKKVYILRPCMIHGPGNKGNLNLLYNLVKKGLPWPLGDFENKRSFTSIDNLSYVLSEILSKDVDSGIYHIGDDEPISTNELISMIGDSVNKKSKIWKIPQKWMKAAAALGEKLHLPLNKERLHKLTQNYVVSNEKLKNALGIKKLPFTAKEGMKKTLKSFQK